MQGAFEVALSKSTGRKEKDVQRKVKSGTCLGILEPGDKVFWFVTKRGSTLQIPNSLGDKFSQWDSQNETLITHYEKKNRDHAKYFLFWENHASLTIYLIEL